MRNNRGYFPATLGAAVRQKARWLGGIAFAGWDRLGWDGGFGERWMRLRDRRGPLAALLIVAAYLAAFLWSQIGLAKMLGAPVEVRIDPALATLLTVNAWLLAWRVLMRAAFTASAYGLEEGLLSMPPVRWKSDRGACRIPRLVPALRRTDSALGQDPTRLS